MRDSCKLALAVLMAAIAVGCGSEDAEPATMDDIVPPAGYDEMIVYMANALVPIDEVVPVDGDHFQREIMRRDDDAYERVRTEALDYFRERYGVIDGDKDPRFLFGSYQVEPFANYRAYHIASEKVPSGGWQVRDGGWQLRVIDPAGYTWEAGEFAGQFAPPGTYVLYGDYNIQTDDCGDRESCDDPREIVMHYRSRCPIEVSGVTLPEIVTFKFSCEVFSERWGQGLGQGISQPAVVEGGSMFQYNAREVITFSSKVGF